MATYFPVFLLWVLLILCSTPINASYNAKVAKRLMKEAADLSATPINTTTTTQAKKSMNIAANYVRRNGCNLNLCFALDGSKSVGPEDYELQKQFVLLVSAIIGADDDASFSAVQYGIPREKISTLETNPSKFLRRIEASRFTNSDIVTVAGGLSYCTTRFRTRTHQANKIVLLGDGGSKFGGQTGPLGPAGVAETFRNVSKGNSVCAVAVGFKGGKPPMFLDIVGNDPRLVVTVDQWGVVLNEARSLVREICKEVPGF